MTGQAQFDVDAAAAARDFAISVVATHANETYKRRALFAIRLIAQTQIDLTSDDARRLVERTWPELGTPNMKVWGPLMNEAKSRGWIAPTDSVRSDDRVACHRRPKRVWRSRIYTGRRRDLLP